MNSQPIGFVWYYKIALLNQYKISVYHPFVGMSSRIG